MPLQHNKTPACTSAGIFAFDSACLNSDNLSSFINTVSCGATLVESGSKVNTLESSSSTKTIIIIVIMQVHYIETEYLPLAHYLHSTVLHPSDSLLLLSAHQSMPPLHLFPFGIAIEKPDCL